MASNKEATPIVLDAIAETIEDAADLTPKELQQERLARLEELKKRAWMAQSAAQLAGRIPVSVFAMGDLASAG